MRIWKVFKTKAAAERYIQRNFSWRQEVRIESVMEQFVVVSGTKNY